MSCVSSALRLTGLCAIFATALGVGQAAAADDCRVTLTEKRSVRSAIIAQAGPHAVPAAILGLAAGARYATGPTEISARRVVVDTGADRAVAIAAYRRCRAEAALRTASSLSN